jgi:hypothetical protein
VLTLKAAGLVDIDAGAALRPGILRILLPGLMDMEVNLLMGGRGETLHLSPIQDDPRHGCARHRQEQAGR